MLTGHFAFPTAARPEGLSLNLQPEQVIDERAMVDLPGDPSSNSQSEPNSKEPAGLLNLAQAHRFVNALSRSTALCKSLQRMREAAQLVQVTNEQLDVLTDLEANPRMLVRSGAATGKTVIAQEHAKRLADENKDVSPFFNKSIAATDAGHSIDMDQFRRPLSAASQND